MDMELKRTDRRLVRAGSALDYYEDEVMLPDGTRQWWEFVHHRKGGGACVVPVLEDGRILLVRQDRPCIGRQTLELPAGARDPEDTDAAQTAARELEEETGYAAGKMKFLAKLMTAPSWCDESTSVYLAENVRPAGGQHLDPAENITMEIYTIEELKAMIAEGEIQDGKTVAGIMAYAALLNNA